MGQRSSCLGSSSVGHQPAGHSDGHGHQGKESGDHQCDDESYLGDADLLISSAVPLGVNARLRPPLDGEDGVGLDHDLLSQLAGVDLGLLSGLSLLPAVGVTACAVLWLALAEADSDVALESDVVTAGELEGVEDRREDSSLSLVLPLPEDRGVCSTAVLIGDQILVLAVVVHGVGHAAPGVPSVYCIRLHIYLEHETITYLSSVYIFSIGITNSHGASRRGASVCDGPGSG